jgi:hypothetical protein
MEAAQVFMYVVLNVAPVSGSAPGGEYVPPLVIVCPACNIIQGGGKAAHSFLFKLCKTPQRSTVFQ